MFTGHDWDKKHQKTDSDIKYQDVQTVFKQLIARCSRQQEEDRTCRHLIFECFSALQQGCDDKNGSSIIYYKSLL